MSLADRLIAGLRAQERGDVYHVERPIVRDVSEAYDWLMAYRDPEGRQIWLSAGDRQRRRLIRRLFWLRWVHRKDWLSRGGRES